MRLERSGGVVYKLIPRVNETAEGVVRTEFSVDCYNISVVDWEEDGSIGSLPLNITIAPLVVATDTSTQDTSTRSTGQYHQETHTHVHTCSTEQTIHCATFQVASWHVLELKLVCCVYIFWLVDMSCSTTQNDVMYEAHNSCMVTSVLL